ncbi:MAG: ECF RNA polymerase sigma factor SigK [Ilumatobacteraceae bacterium]
MLRNALRRRGDDDRDESGDPLGALLSRASRGDQAAFADLYDSLAPLLHGIVLKVLRDPAHSEEVTQEAFIELWRLAPRYDASRGSVKSWAATVAHRRAIDRVRSEQSGRDRTEREAHKRPIHSIDVAEQVVANIDGTRVRKALERLTGIQRQAVELAYFGGHSYREVALLLDVAEGTIKTRIRDGMIRLRDELGVAT